MLRERRSLSLAGLLVLAGVTGASAQVDDCKSDAAGMRPDNIYGARLGFDVLRNGDRVGTHDTYFSVDKGQVTVQSETRIKIKVLFVTAYSFNYESQSVWCNGTMTGFSAYLNDNGKKQAVKAAQVGAQYDVSGKAGDTRVEGPLHVNEHWNRGVLRDGRVMNAVNGRLVSVKVTDLGDDMVEVKGGKLPARHYRYSGELETDVWYDRTGRWVKMRFVTKKDKSVIEYFCTTCSLSTTAKAG
jgi:hypothetical protein